LIVKEGKKAVVFPLSDIEIIKVLSSGKRKRAVI